MKKKQIIIILVTILLLILVFSKIDISTLINTFKSYNFKNIVPIVILYVLSMYLRGFRWKFLLACNPKYSAIHLGEVFIVGTFLNSFLPARVGDLYRAYYLGNVKQESKLKILGSVILERILDGIAVLGMLLIAIIFYCRQQWIINIAYTAGILFVGALLAFFIVYKFDKIDFLMGKIISLVTKLPEPFNSKLSMLTEKFSEFAKSLISGFEALGSPKFFVSAFLLSIVVWVLECAVTWLIISDFNIGLGCAASVFVITLIAFSTMIPSASVFVGPYQYAYILALGIFGIDKSIALGVAIVNQSILMLIVTLIGSIFMLKLNVSVKDISHADKN